MKSLRIVAGVALALLAGSARAAPTMTAEAQAGFFAGPNIDFNSIVPGFGLNVTTTDHPALATFSSQGSGAYAGSYWHAFAGSNFGVLGASAAVYGPEVDAHRLEANATARWHDTFLITGGTGPGTFRMPFAVDGYLSGETHAYFEMNGDPNQGLMVHNYDGAMGAIGDTSAFTYSFVYDQPFSIFAVLHVVADSNPGHAGIANFASTARILGAIVQDSGGSPVDSAIVESGSGVDYNNLGSVGVIPVPEPETYAMLLAGLGLLGFAARRTRQRPQ